MVSNKLNETVQEERASSKKKKNVESGTDTCVIFLTL